MGPISTSLRSLTLPAWTTVLCAGLLSSQGVRVSGPLVQGGDVQRFAWTPDGSRLVYAADEEEDNAYTLYSVAADAWRGAGTPGLVRLGPGLDFRVSPDSHLVAFSWSSCRPPYCFVASADLHCAPVDGSYPVWDLNQGLPGTPSRMRFNADSSRVVFLESVSGRWVNDLGLFSNTSHGGDAPVSLTEPSGMLDGYEYIIETVQLSSDGGRVVFKQIELGYGSDFDTIALFSVPIDRALPPVALTAPFFDSEQDVQRSFQIGPDSERVLFVADQEEPGVLELYSAPIAGGPLPVRLGPPLATQADVDPAFRITPDGASALFVADIEQDEVFELWSVPLDPTRGSVPVRLSAKPVPGGDVARGVERTTAGDEYSLPYPQFEASPDGKRVVFRADASVDEVFELFSVPLDSVPLEASAPPVRLNAPFGPGQDVALFGFRITQDARRVVYAAQDAGGVLRLHAAPIDGGTAPVELGGAFVAGGGLWLHASEGAALSFELTPDGATVVYLADQRADEVIELFAAPTDGSRPARALNGPLVAGGDVRPPGFFVSRSPFALSPDGKWVAYLADQEADEVHELFVSRVAWPRLRRASALPTPLGR